jgi:hypothetical protein
MKDKEPQRAPRRITPFETPQFASARFPLTESAIIALVQSALDEDAAFGDITTLATVLPARRTRARLVAREQGVISGVPFALAAFRILDERVEIRVDAEDGTTMQAGETVLFLSGHARGLLAAERTALNFMQHLSGIASLTRKFVDAVKGTRSSIRARHCPAGAVWRNTPCAAAAAGTSASISRARCSSRTIISPPSTATSRSRSNACASTRQPERRFKLKSKIASRRAPRSRRALKAFCSTT